MDILFCFLQTVLRGKILLVCLLKDHMATLESVCVCVRVGVCVNQLAEFLVSSRTIFFQLFCLETFHDKEEWANNGLRVEMLKTLSVCVCVCVLVCLSVCVSVCVIVWVSVCVRVYECVWEREWDKKREEQKGLISRLKITNEKKFKKTYLTISCI